jgi:hypothetical protein
MNSLKIQWNHLAYIDIFCCSDLNNLGQVLQVDVANMFNCMSENIIMSQELQMTRGEIIQLILFVHTFYAFESPLYFILYNWKGDVTIIPMAMGTY